MSKLSFNPFYIILIFYLLVNLVFSILGVLQNNVEIEFSFYELKKISFIYAFFLQFFCCFLIFLVFRIFCGREKKKAKVIGNKGAIYLLLFQVLFLLYNSIYGVNIAGVAAKSSNEILNIFFILLPADIFFIIFAPYIASNKLFGLNTLLFIISNILRGWMGGVLLAIVIFFCRKGEIRISFKQVFRYVVVILLTVLFLPYLIQMKWVVRSGGDLFLIGENVNTIGYVKLLNESFYYVFNRFQHNYHVALLLENYAQLNNEYAKGNILPFWREGVVQSIISKLLGLNNPSVLGNVMARELFFSRDTWSSNPGLAGWLVVVQEKFFLLIFYVFFILLIGFYTAAKYFDRKMLLTLGSFSVLYLFHGWIGMYVSLVSYLIIVSVLRRIKL